MTIRFSLFIILLSAQFTASAQLDSIHWLPPMHGRGEFGPQYLYISTPETIAFPVEIRNGSGTLLTTLNVSNSQPQRYSLGSASDNVVLASEADLHKPLKNKGLVVHGEKKFYVNFRYHSSSTFQAGDLTCKGISGLGTVFRLAHVFQASNTSNTRSNFCGWMATEDSTEVTLSDFDPAVDFQINSTMTSVSGPQVFMLNKGESVVISQYITNNSGAQPPNGLIGALLSSTKPIVVNTGSWTGSPVGDNSNDVGLDQIAPFPLVGKEYILCKGNGSEILETPLVVAHVDNTTVKINGAATPIATLNAGQFIRLNTNQYSAYGNMHIETSEPVFVYQIIGGVPDGDNQQRTAGFIFVPPISCGIPNAVDNIYQPNQIGDLIFDGGFMIVAMRDSVVTLRVNNNIVPLGTPDPVLGNPDFVTYRRLSLFSEGNPITTASIVAKGAVQVAMYGRNGAAGFGAFYSGFSKTNKPDIALKVIGDGVCPDTIVASGRFDGVQWYYADSLLTYGPDSIFIAYAPGQYIGRGYLGVCRRNDFALDSIVTVFNSPEFPYTIQEPSCYGFSNGQVIFGTPSGGLAPYSFSIDKGYTFSQNPVFNTMRAGDYDLVARDSTGCYNRPIDISIGQPDSLSVVAQIVQIQEPVKAGATVILGATPNYDVIAATWQPQDSASCADDAYCLSYIARPIETTWYEVTVTDEKGCTATDRVQIVIEPNIYAPNIINSISLNGNDRFVLFSKQDLQVNWLRIYDRWGSLVFENQHFMTNDYSAGWDGSTREKQLTPAVFVFTAEIEYAEGRKIYLKGDVTLVHN